MNLSRIIKNSDDFTPESIVADASRKPPQWGSVTTHIETDKQQNAPFIRQNNAPLDDDTVQTKAETAETPGPETKQLENDFTTPVSEEEKSTSQEKSQPEDSEKTPQEEVKEPAVDVAALTKEHYNKGLQAGIEQMEADYGSALNALLTSCEQLNSLRDTILRNSIDEIKELVIVIAEKIIRASLDSQKETVLKNVEEAIKLAVRSDEFKVFLNPDDIETIKSHSDDLVNSVSGLENIILQPDTSIDPGGCLIESSNCTVDATIASQFKLLQEEVVKKS